jgi:hypothetical protein
LDEVKATAMTLGMPDVECERFFHHYEARGWMMGSVPMRNLRSALISWKINPPAAPRGTPSSTLKPDHSAGFFTKK